MLLADGEEITITSRGHTWKVAWYPPSAVPEGVHHGAAGLCLTTDQQLILISPDGDSWDLPAGRPEGKESWEQTLYREVREEACATVICARLLGFTGGYRIDLGPPGDRLLRAVYLAQVELQPWEPKFEIKHRKLVMPAAGQAMLLPEYNRIWQRIFLAAELIK